MKGCVYNRKCYLQGLRRTPDTAPATPPSNPAEPLTQWFSVRPTCVLCESGCAGVQQLGATVLWPLYIASLALDHSSLVDHSSYPFAMPVTTLSMTPPRVPVPDSVTFEFENGVKLTTSINPQTKKHLDSLEPDTDNLIGNIHMLLSMKNPDDIREFFIKNLPDCLIPKKKFSANDKLFCHICKDKMKFSQKIWKFCQDIYHIKLPLSL